MANFKLAMTYVIGNEGVKYTDLRDDLGGPTKYGVTLATLQDYRRRKEPGRPTATRDDVAGLTLEQASEVYRSDYWDKVAGEQLASDPVACCLFDAAVNCGPATVLKRAQSVLVATGNSIAADGVVGPKTIAALNAAVSSEFVFLFVQAQLRFYMECVKRDPRQQVFFRGWSRRATAYLETVI